MAVTAAWTQTCRSHVGFSSSNPSWSHNEERTFSSQTPCSQSERAWRELPLRDYIYIYILERWVQKVFWAYLKKYCLPLAGVVEENECPHLLCCCTTVLIPSPNLTWALGSAAQLSLSLALHCIITWSSCIPSPVSAQLLCSAALLEISNTRNPFFQLFSHSPPCFSIAACTAPPPSPALQQLASFPHLCSQVLFLHCSTAESFEHHHLSPELCGTAQPWSTNPTSCCSLPCSALSIQYQAAVLLKHSTSFMLLLPYLWCCKDPPHPTTFSARFLFGVP